MHRKVQLVVSGGIRSGADVGKALALGADAVAIGVAALIALGDNAPELDDEYRKLGSAAGFYDAWHEGRDPAGISTQDPELAARLDPVAAGDRLANYPPPTCGRSCSRRRRSPARAAQARGVNCGSAPSPSGSNVTCTGMPMRTSAGSAPTRSANMNGPSSSATTTST